MGLALVDRSLTNLKLRTPVGEVVSYTVLQIFPFTSETKRMGIILKEEATGDITFYMKVCFDPFWVSFCNKIGLCTGKSLLEALIFASTNPQYDNRLFIKLQVQYMKIPSSNLEMLCTEIVLLMFCKKKNF